MHDHDVGPTWRSDWWSWIGPDTFLTGPHRIGLRPHANPSEKRRCSTWPNVQESQIEALKVERPTHGRRAAIPKGLSTGIARHIAAKAAAPDTSTPSSLAWKRASNSMPGLIGTRRILACGIDKVDDAGPVEPTHECNFAAAQRAPCVVPDGQLAHTPKVVSRVLPRTHQTAMSDGASRPQAEI